MVHVYKNGWLTLHPTSKEWEFRHNEEIAELRWYNCDNSGPVYFVNDRLYVSFQFAQSFVAKIK